MNIAIMSCEQIKDESCIGCQRCLTAMHRRDGELERYKDVPHPRNLYNAFVSALDSRIGDLFDISGVLLGAEVRQLAFRIADDRVDLVDVGLQQFLGLLSIDRLAVREYPDVNPPVVTGTVPAHLASSVAGTASSSLRRMDCSCD